MSTKPKPENVYALSAARERCRLARIRRLRDALLTMDERSLSGMEAAAGLDNSLLRVEFDKDSSEA